MSSVTLFGLERSVYTRVARLALEEKGVAYSLQEVEIFGSGGVPTEHLRRHPFGRIPALRHGDFSLYETAAITRYIDEGFQGPALQPPGSTARARMGQVIGILDSYAYRPMVWGVFVQRISVPHGGTPDEDKIASAMVDSAKCLAALEEICAAGPFLVGERISLADLHAFPILRYFSLTPEGSSALPGYPALHGWMQSMLARPSVLGTASTYESRCGH